MAGFRIGYLRYFFAVRLSLLPLNYSSTYSNFSTIYNNILRAVFGALDSKLFDINKVKVVES